MKINKIILLSLLIFGVLPSCTDNREQFMEDYSSILYITNSGEQTIPLYKSGEPTTYKLGIYKSGVNNNASAKAEITVPSQDYLDIYNEENGTAIKLLPESCYQLKNTIVNFNSDNNAYIDIVFDTDNIAKLPALNEGEVYALPVKLYSDTKINEDKDFSILKTVIEKATVGFDNTDVTTTKFSKDGGNSAETEEIKIVASFTNSWDITFNISNADKYVEDYNKANNRNFRAMPSGSYTISTEKIGLANGSQELKFKYSIDKSKLGIGQYLLPVVITDLSKFEIQENADKKFLLINYDYADFIEKENWVVSGYRDYQEGDGGGPDALIDGALDTYWHANWANGSQLPSWITIKLTDDSKVATVTQVDLYARHNNTSGPKKVEILTSMDGTNFELFGTLNFRSTAECQTIYGDRPLKAKYVKMNITEKNNNSVAMGEMKVKGILE